ncbi:hypothetical protein ACTMTI_06155 [Nonomuraea sp. H19]|uniref:hypothetical protein n=1 Tax=Nonomuraea sp. H19 TaxID=3452206 RepID=UPI003F8A3405
MAIAAPLRRALQAASAQTITVPGEQTAALLVAQLALISIRCHLDSRAFYERKRAEGKLHTQAVLALARRRVNVLWALIRDRRCYAAIPPRPQAA